MSDEFKACRRAVGLCSTKCNVVRFTFKAYRRCNTLLYNKCQVEKFSLMHRFEFLLQVYAVHWNEVLKRVVKITFLCCIWKTILV